ncbi:hypothetical protein [Streptomyces sp. YIM 121038]|uniref:hypothetical protein n=1 Tax=Streptomyces sp. YIM 121038 TaxID=2136401 RepID=UPI00111075A2|nr:hypothetical protein [Streptomyces sp. YIM 121038]
MAVSVAAAVTAAAPSASAEAARLAGPSVVTPNTCGGLNSEFTGSVLPDAPFKGDLTVVIDNVTFKYTLTITPTAANGNTVNVNALLPSGEEVSTTSSFILDVNNLGKGSIRFQSPTGSGRSTDVSCTGLVNRSRVTKITGKMTDPTITNHTIGDFTVSRPAI